MSLLIVGTVAFDSIETPFQKIDKVVGGSGTYIGLSASYFYKSIQLVSVVGGDFPSSMLKLFNHKGIDTSGVEMKKEQKSFFWSGKYHLDMNSRDTLITDLNVLAEFDPKLPENYTKPAFVLLGNIDPILQIKVIKQLKTKPKLIAMDTMNFWMDIAIKPLKKVLKMVDMVIVNDSEARQLSGEHSLVKAANKIMKMGPKHVIIKKGEHGALLFSGKKIFHAPALPLEDVFDPTGAGDAFAGGFMGYLAQSNHISFEHMKRALIYGSAMASFCVEKFGPHRLLDLNKIQIQKRVNEFVSLMNVNLS